MRAIKRPCQLYPLGILFGLGFDTATEIFLLDLAGARRCVHAGAYQWAFVKPVRKVYYDLTTTAPVRGRCVGHRRGRTDRVLHDRAGLTDPVTSWVAGISLGDIGYAMVALFVLLWLGSSTGGSAR